MIASLKDQLLRDEELRLKPYKDSVGKLTIGVGRNLDDDGISVQEAGVLLANDIAAATIAVEQAFPWTDALDDIRRCAVVNMAFNLGIRGLSQFTDFLGKLQAGKFPEASAAMLDSLWAKQVGARATRLAKQILTGEWQ
jgi:lysozyme